MECKKQTKVPELKGGGLLTDSKIVVPKIDSARHFFVFNFLFFLIIFLKNSLKILFKVLFNSGLFQTFERGFKSRKS